MELKALADETLYPAVLILDVPTGHGALAIQGTKEA